MPPALARDNLVDCRPVHPEPSRDRSARLAAGRRRPDGHDRLLVDLRSVVPAPSWARLWVKARAVAISTRDRLWVKSEAVSVAARNGFRTRMRPIPGSSSRPSLGVAIVHVVRRRAEKEVLRIDAGARVAVVAHEQPRGDDADVRLESDAMCSTVFPATPQLAVSTAVDAAGEQPASSVRLWDRDLFEDESAHFDALTRCDGGHWKFSIGSPRQLHRTHNDSCHLITRPHPPSQLWAGSLVRTTRTTRRSTFWTTLARRPARRSTTTASPRIKYRSYSRGAHSPEKIRRASPRDGHRPMRCRPSGREEGGRSYRLRRYAHHPPLGSRACDSLQPRYSWITDCATPRAAGGG